MSESKTPVPGNSPKSTDKPNKKLDAKAQSKTVKQPSNKSAVWLLWALAALAFIAAIAFFQYRVETLIKQNSALGSHVQLLDSQYKSQLSKSIEQDQALKQFVSMNKKLNFMQQTINQIPGARKEDWKLAEVEYLLRLANQRVTLQQEPIGARALFDAANKILATLDDPAFLMVRETIANEMLLLGQDKKIDRQGIYTQIQAIKANIHDDILPPTEFVNTQILIDEAVKDESFWAQLKSLVSLKRADAPFAAPLNIQQYQLLEHSLLLMLEQAQWALLKADQTLYNASLNNAVQWIEARLRHQKAATLISEITKVKNQDIKLALPDVSHSLRLLRQTLSDRTHRPNIVAPTNSVTPAFPKVVPTKKKQPEQV